MQWHGSLDSESEIRVPESSTSLIATVSLTNSSEPWVPHVFCKVLRAILVACTFCIALASSIAHISSNRGHFVQTAAVDYGVPS